MPQVYAQRNAVGVGRPRAVRLPAWRQPAPLRGKLSDILRNCLLNATHARPPTPGDASLAEAIHYDA
jgi:hypothetical protein